VTPTTWISAARRQSAGSPTAAAHHLLEVARHLARTQPTHAATNTSSTATSCDIPSAPTGVRPAERTADDPDDGALEQRATRSLSGPDPAPHWANPDDWSNPTNWARPNNMGAVADQGEQEASTGPALSASIGRDTSADLGAATDAFTRQMLASELPARLAAIKQHAHSNGLGAGSGGSGSGSGSGRRKQHTLYVHLTDRTLATGDGVLRVEELGPRLANQLTELLGHDQIVIKPVIDLHNQINVHSYEIPDRIRERVRLQHPVDAFPYGGAEATTRMDQDHITPYDRTGPPTQTRQTCTDNLIPLTRLHHRAKTFGGWRNRRLPTGAIEWISPHGFRFVVNHTGTHPTPPASDAGEFDAAEAAAQ
jgi:hypothetical protein